jgi:hypothetical protein
MGLVLRGNFDGMATVADQAPTAGNELSMPLRDPSKGANTPKADPAEKDWEAAMARIWDNQL